MSKNQTEKSRYQSLFSPGKYVTFAQYLAEIMCARRGGSEGADLPSHFWESSPKWQKYFTYQILLANKLLKKYSEHVILTAVKEMSYVFSLKLKALEDKMIEVSKRAVVKSEEIAPAEEASTGRFNRKSKLGNLDD